MDRVTLSNSEFKKKHMKIVRQYNDRLTTKILPEWGRGRWFLSNLPNPSGGILDLCGGFGYWGAYVLKVGGYCFDYTCLDKHEICENFGPKYFELLGLTSGTFVCHNINNPLPFCNMTFNQVWLFGWWVERFDTDVLFREINRILKIDGYFLLDAATMLTLGNGKPYPLCFTKEGLESSLELAGFKIIKNDVFYRARLKNERNSFMGVVCVKHAQNTRNNHKIYK